MVLFSPYRQAPRAASFAVRVSLANAFLLFPLIVMTAQVFWGHDYSSTVLKFFVYALTFSVTPLFGLVGYWLYERCREHNGATSLLEAALSIPGMTAALLYLGPGGSWVDWEWIEFVAVLASLTVATGLSLVFFLPFTWASTAERVCRPIVYFVRLSTPLICVAVGSWGEAGWLVTHAVSDHAFQLGMIVGAGCVVLICVGPRMLTSRRLLVWAAGILSLGLCALGAATLSLPAAFHPHIPCDGGPRA